MKLGKGSKSMLKNITTLIIFVMLFDSVAVAAPPPKGFQPGAKSFNNPFANPAPAAQQPVDDDDDEDEDEGPPPAANRNVPPAVSAGGDAGGAPLTTSDLSMGGTPPGGVVASTKLDPLQVDTETGMGDKTVVQDFNFPDADILDIAKALGRLTGKNFILDKDVKGRVTLISNSPITIGDAWKAFLTALDMNGFGLIPSGKYIRIARNRDARDKQLKTYTGEFTPDTDALITKIFPLKHISADEVARVFRGFMPATSRILPHEETNTVIVTDTGSNIVKLSKILDLLDVEGFDAIIEVISVKYASAVELSKLIDTLIPGTGNAAGQPGGGVGRFRGGGGGRFSARRTKQGGVINTVIADERTNTLIVHANQQGAEEVKELVAKLDRKVPFPLAGGKVHVMYLQFADAEQVANTLNNISQGAKGGAPTASTAPGAGGTGVNPVSASLFEGSIKVSPDKATNSLVITASPADFGTIQRVVNKLDIPRDEVYVEIVIMEVAIQKSFDYSTGVASPRSGIAILPSADLLAAIQSPIPTTPGAFLRFKGGAEQSFTVGGQNISVAGIEGLIKFIQKNVNANILATPQIIALDNSEAEFESSEKVPVPVVTQVVNAGAQTSFTKESVSLKIKIKPQINKLSNFVKLDIDTKLSDINNSSVPEALKNQTFGTTDRNAKTTVVVGDGDTVVLGGLIRDKVTDDVSKVPLLGDLPILGWLFKATTNRVTKNNLLIFLTPHIVRQYEKIRAVLDKKLKERDDFIEESAGGDDPLRKYRDDIIRGLPDIKDLAKKPQTSFSIDAEDSMNNTQTDNNPFTGQRRAPTPQAPAVPVPGQPTPGQAPADSNMPPTQVTPDGNPVVDPNFAIPVTPPMDQMAPQGPPPMDGGGQ
jgi:general secretion pathway protein D